MKLELKHLCAYLPFSIHCMVLNFDNEEKEYILDCVTTESYRSLCFIDIDGNELPAEACLIGEERVKPLLIPLDKISDSQWIEIFASGMLSVGHVYWPIAEPFIERTSDAIEIIVKSKSYTFDFKASQFETQPYAFNQRVAFEKLYELHVDLNDLIGAGLALNKLEILNQKS